ncbi:MerR family transcriptional regulator [Kibdelosporangium phytohabitans]|uniref:MerR family transcriptional regulator n=1 Tax=Kibdelosporangium phytohabitans TaxID=860235 RepID=A0A0N9ICQ3_9PSEU|nr:MerR family transcriptional regulator [Kibdelosporangium phytohabitans]ALG14125.1 MerR family transcriptional regulator [Kibdelosporangium phytohabitans]MBE1466889.1 DNA-binding transcriptional MerR regulator [Kibdelosporangium phytohabitans]
MKIGDLARATGISTRLLRYYEEQGLITPYRTTSGHRVYGRDAADQVRHIRDLLAAGLSTSAIRDLLPCVEGPGLTLRHCAAPTLASHLKGMDDRISSLQAARTALADLLTRSTWESAPTRRR